MLILGLVLAYYVVASLVAYVMFRRDKKYAVEGHRRTPEKVLHRASWLGGWPGSLVAIYTIRHKNRKRGFMAVTWTAAAAHILAWISILVALMG